MKLRLVGAAVLAAVGVGAVVLVVVRPGAAASDGTQYLTARATRADVTSEVAANGTLEPVTRYGLVFGAPPAVLASSSSSSSSSSGGTGSSTSGAASASWPVTSVNVTAGQAVRKGDVLAVADGADVAAQLAQAVNQLTVAELQLAQASADLAAATTDQQTRQAQIAYYGAKNQVAQARQQAAALRAAAALSTIRAPADGTVEAVNVSPGADAVSGPAIVVDAGGLQAVVSIAEADLPSLKVGQAATVSIGSIGSSETGKVASIGPAAAGGNNSVVTYPVTVSLGSVPSTARAGMTASVSITVAQATDTIAVPAISLISGNGGYSVRVMGANGAVTEQAVTVGLVTSDLAQITSGLSEGQQVVIGVATARQATTTTGGGFGGLGGAVGGFRGAGGNGRPGQ